MANYKLILNITHTLIQKTTKTNTNQKQTKNKRRSIKEHLYYANINIICYPFFVSQPAMPKIKQSQQVHSRVGTQASQHSGEK